MTPRERQVAQVRAEAEARRGVTQGKAALDFASDKARLESLNAAVGSNLALHTPGPDGFTPYEWNLRKVREEAEARQRVELDPNAVQARVAERAATETAVGKAKTAQEGSPAALAVVGRQASQREKGAAAGAAAGMNLPLDTVGGKTPGELKAEQVARETKARTMNMAPSLDMAKVLTAEEQVISSLDTVVRHFDPKFIGGVRGSDWLQAIRTRIGPRLPGMIAGKEAKFDAALATARQQFGRALTGLAMTDQERTDFLEIFPTKFQGSPEAFIARLENVYNDVHVRITRYREILGHTREEAMAPGAAQSEKVTFVPGPGGKGLQKLPPMFEMDTKKFQGLPFREFLQRNTQYGKVLQGELDRAIAAGEVPPGTVLEDVIDFK